MDSRNKSWTESRNGEPARRTLDAEEEMTEGDEIVPLDQGKALFAAAPEPKRLHVFAGAGHNDLLERAGNEWATTIAQWVRDLPGPPAGP